MIIIFEELQVNTSDGDYIPTDEELAELLDDEFEGVQNDRR